jgi:membrane fusion protein (multidrug efflux system)
MSKRTTWIILAVAIMAIIIFVKWKVISPDPPSSQTLVAKKPVMHLQGVIAKSGIFQNILKVNGTILPDEQVQLHPEISGKVIGIYFKEGSRVRKGDLLVKINDADLQANLQKLNSQKNLDESNEQRQKQMLNIQGISQQEYDAAVNQLNVTMADIHYTEAQIAKTEIRAPFDGTVALRHISTGDFVSENTEITDVVSTSQLKIEFSIPEQYALLIKNGAEVMFSPEGSAQNFAAEVYAVDPLLEQNTRSLVVRAVFNNKNNEVFPGQFASVTLALKKSNNAILLPTQTVVPDISGQKIYVIDSGKVHPSRIEVGARTDSMVEVLSGVTEGDTVLLTGLQFVTPGLQIKVDIIK